MRACKTDSPSRLCDDHLGAELVELVPELLRLEEAVDAHQLGAVALGLHHADLVLLLLLFLYLLARGGLLAVRLLFRSRGRLGVVAALAVAALLHVDEVLVVRVRNRAANDLSGRLLSRRGSGGHFGYEWRRRRQ